MPLIFSTPSISLLFVLFTISGTGYYTELIFAFHQNYPEFDKEDKVKEIYELLKDSPNFRSKLIQLENVTDHISLGCNLNMLMSNELPKSKTVRTNLEICDEDVQAMKEECDKHYDVMFYCKDKTEFMTNYIAGRNLTEESVGKVASASPK
jgi:hypothetical protein